MPRTPTLKLADIRSKLPEEARKWLDRMDREELLCTEIVLNNVDEESFIENWRLHQDHLDFLNHF